MADNVQVQDAGASNASVQQPQTSLQNPPPIAAQSGAGQNAAQGFANNVAQGVIQNQLVQPPQQSSPLISSPERPEVDNSAVKPAAPAPGAPAPGAPAPVTGELINDPIDKLGEEPEDQPKWRTAGKYIGRGVGLVAGYQALKYVGGSLTDLADAWTQRPSQSEGNKQAADLATISSQNLSGSMSGRVDTGQEIASRKAWADDQLQLKDKQYMAQAWAKAKTGIAPGLMMLPLTATGSVFDKLAGTYINSKQADYQKKMANFTKPATPEHIIMPANDNLQVILNGRSNDPSIHALASAEQPQENYPEPTMPRDSQVFMPEKTVSEEWEPRAFSDIPEEEEWQENEGGEQNGLNNEAYAQPRIHPLFYKRDNERINEQIEHGRDNNQMRTGR